MSFKGFHQLSKNELESLKKVELEILKVVVSIIDSLGLSYYAVGGTALGAYKYSGFIPWDDDIDIAMPREDFMIFVKEAPKLLPNHLSLQSLYTDKNYTLGVAKVRDERTTFFDAYTAQYDVSHGVFIDIFPIDFCGENIPSNSIKYKMRENKIAYSNYFKPDNIKLKNRIVSFFSKLFLLFLSPYKCALKNDLYLASVNKKYNNSPLSFMRIEQHRSEFFKENNKLDFDGLSLRVPNKIEEYLNNCYGDVSIDPPVEKQYPHHFVLAFDLNKSYKEYRFKDGMVVPKE